MKLTILLFTVIILKSCSSPLSGNDNYGNIRDSKRTTLINKTTNNYLGKNLDKNLRWKAFTGNAFGFEPKTLDSTIIIGEGSHITSLNINSGEEYWSYQLNSYGIYGSTDIHNQMIFFGHENGLLYAFNLKSKKVEWTYSIVNLTDKDKVYIPSIYSNPVYNEEVIYTGGDNLHAINAKTGKLIWKKFNKYGVKCTPLVKGNTVYFGSRNGVIQAADKTNGNLLWEYETNTLFESSFISYNDNLYFGDENGNFYSLKEKNGELNWSVKLKGLLNAKPLVFNNDLIVTSSSNTLYTVNTTNGEIIRQFKTVGNLFSSPLIKNGFAYLGDNLGNLYIINCKNGVLNSKYKTSGNYYKPPISIKDAILLPTGGALQYFSPVE